MTGSIRKVVISTYNDKDKHDLFYQAITKHYVIYEEDKEGKKTLYRHFLMQPDGSIIEIFEQYKVTLNSNQYNEMNSVLMQSNENEQLSGLFDNELNNGIEKNVDEHSEANNDKNVLGMSSGVTIPTQNQNQSVKLLHSRKNRLFAGLENV